MYRYTLAMEKIVPSRACHPPPQNTLLACDAQCVRAMRRHTTPLKEELALRVHATPCQKEWVRTLGKHVRA